MRERIPIVLASLGQKAVAQTAEIAEGWMPALYYPERADLVWGDALAAGAAKRDGSLGALDVFASPALYIGPGAEAVLPVVKEHIALYVGGMGARGKNFYSEVAALYGFGDDADRIQELYLSGRKEEAVAAVPDEFARGISLIGTPAEVAERLAAFRAAGVTTLAVMPLGRTADERLRLIEGLLQLAG